MFKDKILRNMGWDVGFICNELWGKISRLIKGIAKEVWVRLTEL